jgi:hypothetical protein
VLTPNVGSVKKKGFAKLCQLARSIAPNQKKLERVTIGVNVATNKRGCNFYSARNLPTLRSRCRGGRQ